MKAPALFVSHGSPMAAITEDTYAKTLRAIGRALGKPRAVLVLSAHGTSAPGQVRINASEKPELIYDFGGFPEALHNFTYAPPGAPELARRAADLLAPLGLGIRMDLNAGWDHGVWVPLAHIFPAADVAVLQISMPYPSKPAEILALGKALAPLRQDGMVILGSGGAVHNLGALQPQGAAVDWALEFHRWVKDRVEKGALEDILRWEALAPRARVAHPSPDHFLPIFFTLGAGGPEDKPQSLVDDIQLGTLSLYSFALSEKALATV